MQHERDQHLTTGVLLVACAVAKDALAVVPGRGPGPDHLHFGRALRQTRGRVTIETLLADAGYDGEASHVLARDQYGMRTIIPPKIGQPTAKLPRGRWRLVMATRFNKVKYGKRWQVETVISMVKRLQGSALTARTRWYQCREVSLRAITHRAIVKSR